MKNLTKKQQEVNTRKTIALLKGIGFEQKSNLGRDGDLVYNKFHVIYNVAILVRPPNLSNPTSWRVQVAEPKDLMKTSGQTAFSAEFSTPERVINCVLNDLLWVMLRKGREDFRAKFTSLIEQFKNL